MNSMKQMRHATINDIDALTRLYNKNYLGEERLNELFFSEVFKKNKYVFRLLETEEGIRGLYSLYPFSKGVYEGVLKGTVKPHEVPNFLLSYKNKDISLFLDFLVWDIHSSHDVVEELFEDMRKKLITLSKEKINICEIGSQIPNLEKEELLYGMGFHKTGVLPKENKTRFIFRANVLDVILSKKLL